MLIISLKIALVNSFSNPSKTYLKSVLRWLDLMQARLIIKLRLTSHLGISGKGFEWKL